MDTPPDTTDPAQNPEAAAAQREAGRLLQRALDRLPPEQRAIFVMFELDELTGEEIADILGAPVGTVYTRLRSARELLTATLKRESAKERRLG